MKKLRIVSAVAAALLCVVLAACSGENGKTAGQQSGKTPKPASAAKAGEPKSGQEAKTEDQGTPTADPEPAPAPSVSVPSVPAPAPSSAKPSEPAKSAEHTHTYSHGRCTVCGDTNGPLSPDEAKLFNNKLTDAENAEALAVARKIAAKVPTGVSDLERVSKAAEAVAGYYNRGTHVESGPYYAEAYGVFVKGTSSCAGCTRALGLVLSLMGYGWTHVNENQWTHQWLRLTMDGREGFADGQIGLVGYGPHPIESQM